jgi:hypothetical protein
MSQSLRSIADKYKKQISEVKNKPFYQISDANAKNNNGEVVVNNK